MQSRQCGGRQPRLGHAAPADLIALNRRRHIGQQQNELGTVIGDRTVIAAGERNLDHVGDLGVEGVFRAVAQCYPIPDRVVLRGKLDDEGLRQVLSTAGVADRDPIGRARLTGSDRADLDAVDVDLRATRAQDGRQPLRRHLIRAAGDRCLFAGAHGGD